MKTKNSTSRGRKQFYIFPGRIDREKVYESLHRQTFCLIKNMIKRCFLLTSQDEKYLFETEKKALVIFDETMEGRSSWMMSIDLWKF